MLLDSSVEKCDDYVTHAANSEREFQMQVRNAGQMSSMLQFGDPGYTIRAMSQTRFGRYIGISACSYLFRISACSITQKTKKNRTLDLKTEMPYKAMQ